MGNQNKTILKKSFSRAHTLFYFGVWQENNLNRMEQWAGFNANNILFVREKDGVVSVWYDPDEIERFNEKIKGRILGDDQYFQDFKESFETRWSKLAPYMKGNQEIQDISELKEFYNEWAEWWTLMVMSMNIPEIDELPENIKKEALALRKQTQEYMDEGDKVFADFFENSFPEYEDITSVVLASEVFSLEDSGFNQEELEIIKERKDGCVILNGEVFDRSELDKQLQKSNLQLADEEGRGYQKEFTRNYSLPMLEVWYKGEAYDEKPWLEEKQKHLPYIVFIREDGTVTSFYDPKGVEWIKDKIIREMEGRNNFLSVIAEEVKENLASIEEDYKQKNALTKEGLLNFISAFRDAYPWVETMWWVMHMEDDNELPEGVDTSVLKEVREMTNDLTVGTDAVVRNSLEQLYPEIADFVHVLRIEEIKNNDPPEKEMLEKRDNSFIYTDNKLFLDPSIEEIEEKYSIAINRVDAAKVEKLEGQTAYEGKASGTVKIVTNTNHLNKVDNGDIIVSPMTMPDFVPAMKRAAGFVTDEGGITSHAAITAREMEKPCVVDTEIATQVLEDGDEVEIDAEEGEVKIINSE